MMAQPERKINNLSELISPSALALLSASGNTLVKQLGIDVVRGVVYDVLTGRNLRDSTEALTRRRIALLNLALVGLFLRGSSISTDFVEELPHLATQLLQRNRTSKADRWLAQWMLGLTDKGFQNILRDQTIAVSDYRDRYIHTCREVVQEVGEEQGILSGGLELSADAKAQINWLFLTYLLNAIGAETLTIRGSEKSAYGKLFEKLILGSLLYVLGFEPRKEPNQFDRVFILSERQKRESDATLYYELGKAVRFDIGFIGRGNPEISLDKVTRFQRAMELAGRRWYVGTIIIVDRIGPNSNIEQLANDVDGTIVQMSMGYWPQQVARELHRVVGYEHELINMEQSEIGDYIRNKLSDVPLIELAGYTE